MDFPNVSSSVVVPLVVSRFNNMVEQQNNIPNPQNDHINDEPVNDEQFTNDQVVSQEIALRRSQRQRRPAISSNYVVY